MKIQKTIPELLELILTEVRDIKQQLNDLNKTDKDNALDKQTTQKGKKETTTDRNRRKGSQN